MPERTVDAWVAAAICSVFPSARIWDPTQAIKGRNWDRAFLPSEEGKAFILEDKGTVAVARKQKQPLRTHRIAIDAAQLDWYCDEVEKTGIPVYYVLPQPPWAGGAGPGPIPAQAAFRVDSDSGPFPEWTYVSRCSDLRRKLSGRSSIETHQLPLPGGMSLATFLQDVRYGKAGKWLPNEDMDAAQSNFSSPLVGELYRGRRDSHGGSALAVFLPASSFIDEGS